MVSPCQPTAVRAAFSEQCWRAPHAGQSHTLLNTIVATKDAKSAYVNVKIANAAAGHFAPFARRTTYAANWSDVKRPGTRLTTWCGSSRKAPRDRPSIATRISLAAVSLRLI